MLRAPYLRKEFVQTFLLVALQLPFRISHLPETVRSIENLWDYQNFLGGRVSPHNKTKWKPPPQTLIYAQEFDFHAVKITLNKYILISGRMNGEQPP